MLAGGAIRIISGGLMRDESRDINTVISTLCCSQISRPHTNATGYNGNRQKWPYIIHVKISELV